MTELSYPSVHYLGIRHHSPACSHLVKQQIEALQPTVVLIEGPCDFNHRLDELLLPHQLPIALYSYRFDGEKTAQSWFPFLPYSPEYVALKEANALSMKKQAIDKQDTGKQIADSYFIDLPHWAYRVQSTDNNPSSQKAKEKENEENKHSQNIQDRYSHVLKTLLQQTGYDNQDALWDGWFEHAPFEPTNDKNSQDNKDNKARNGSSHSQVIQDDLPHRLEQYFQTLRGEYQLNAHKIHDPDSDDTTTTTKITTSNQLNEEFLRENFMADWIVYFCQKLAHQSDSTDNNPKHNILVICGGWHVSALKALVTDKLDSCFGSQQPTKPDPLTYLAQYFPEQYPTTETDKSDTSLKQASYLIPYAYKQVDSLSGYGAGMPSPLYYQWLYENKDTAYQKAMYLITEHLRQAKQPLGTAELIAWQHTTRNLANLRGHKQPTRHDILDGFLNACIKEALHQLPPWSANHLSVAQDNTHTRLLQSTDHPTLQAVLMALTGNQRGQLDKATPLPPLFQQIEALLVTTDLLPTDTLQEKILSWRNPADREKLNILWQLQCLGFSSFQLQATSKTSANNQIISKHTPTNSITDSDITIDANETWLLKKNHHWETELIEASRFGAQLDIAAKNALSERFVINMQQLNGHNQINNHSQQAQEAHIITEIFILAIRAGFSHWQDELLSQLSLLLPEINHRDGLVEIGTSLMTLKQQGFWGRDIDDMLNQPLALVLSRLAWLLDGTGRHQSQSDDMDIYAMKLFGFALSELRKKTHTQTTHLNTDDILAILTRLITDNDTALTLRGAGMGTLHQYYHHVDSDTALIDDKLPELNAMINTKIDSLAIIQSLRAKDQLGDFLYGLFACARYILTLPIEQLSNPTTIYGSYGSSTNHQNITHDVSNHIRHDNSEKTLLSVLHESLLAIEIEDFLVALPSLRMAFSWFSAKERQQMARSLAQMMGLPEADSIKFFAQLSQPVNQSDSLLQAKKIEAQAWQVIQQLQGR